MSFRRVSISLVFKLFMWAILSGWQANKNQHDGWSAAVSEWMSAAQWSTGREQKEVEEGGMTFHDGISHLKWTSKLGVSIRDLESGQFLESWALIKLCVSLISIWNQGGHLMDSISSKSSQDSFCCLTFEHTLKLGYGVQMQMLVGSPLHSCRTSRHHGPGMSD